ncbi:MAG: BolA family protein [Gammaproteobacteria bacterium]
MTDRSMIIRKRLEAAFQPEQLSVQDDSHQHVGHAGAQDGRGHFTVEIAAAAFDGKAALECHRMVYSALDDLMTTDIHALRIHARGIREK